MLYLATGLSVGLLSGCNLFSNPDNQPSSSPTPSPTENQDAKPATDDQRTSALNNLETLKQKRTDLNNFVATIKVEADGITVANPVDYAKAKTVVDELAIAYNTFIGSLSNEIRQEINFESINSSIEPVLVGTSEERKILEDLANQQYRNAQTKLSALLVNSEPIYNASDIDGLDGSKQRIATKKLLNNILDVTRPLATLTINSINPNLDPSSPQAPSPLDQGVSPQSLTTDELTRQLEQLKKDIDINRNNWIWPLLNILALTATAGSFFLLWSKISEIVLVYKVQKRRKQETDIQQFKNEIVTIKSSLQEMRNELTKYLKNNESEEELTLTLRKIDEAKHELEKIYHDVILQHLDALDPTQDIIQTYIERLLSNSPIHQDNSHLPHLDALNTKLDQLLQISQQNPSVRSSSENSGILNQIWQRIQQIPSESSALSYEVEQLKSQLQDKNIELKNQSNQIHQLQSQLDSQSQIENQRQNDQQTIRDLESERNQLRKQVEQFNSGEIEQLRQQNQQLNQNYNSLYQSYQQLEQKFNAVEQEKLNLDHDTSNLNNQLWQLQQEKQRVEAERDQYRGDSERYKKQATKQAIETTEIPWQWQSIISDYNRSPEMIFNVHGVQQQGEVVEDKEKKSERRNNASKPVVLSSDTSPDGYFIISVGNDYLLFPKQHAITLSQKFTASALFDGYKSGNTNKFTLISPAQVTFIGNGMWQLKHRGRLEYN